MARFIVIFIIFALNLFSINASPDKILTKEILEDLDKEVTEFRAIPANRKEKIEEFKKKILIKARLNFKEGDIVTFDKNCFPYYNPYAGEYWSFSVTCKNNFSIDLGSGSISFAIKIPEKFLDVVEKKNLKNIKFKLTSQKHQKFIDILYSVTGDGLVFNGTLISTEPLEIGCQKGNCENGEGEYFFDNHDSYKGDWKNNKPHGNGEYISWGQDYIYYGQMSDGMFSGAGKTSYKISGYNCDENRTFVSHKLFYQKCQGNDGKILKSFYPLLWHGKETNAKYEFNPIMGMKVWGLRKEKNSKQGTYRSNLDYFFLNDGMTTSISSGSISPITFEGEGIKDPERKELLPQGDGILEIVLKTPSKDSTETETLTLKAEFQSGMIVKINELKHNMLLVDTDISFQIINSTLNNSKGQIK